MQNEMKKLQQENRALREKEYNKNVEIGSFVQQMNAFMDSNDLHSILNMDVESDDYEEDELRIRRQMNRSRERIETENEEQKPAHSGTGGSSKIKSRPN